MVRTRAVYKLFAIAAVYALGFAPASMADTNVVLNGDFTQYGNPVVFNSPVPQSGPSAAVSWYQFKVVPSSYIQTRDEPVGIGLTRMLHVTTNGGPWGPMGNGVAQSFEPLSCAAASFSVRMLRGQVTGNLVLTTGPFAKYPKFTTTGGWFDRWHDYSQIVGSPVGGIAFETLLGPGADYDIKNVQVRPCPSTIIFQDITLHVDISSMYDLSSPDGPALAIQVINPTRATIEGPLHVLLDNMLPGISVLNSDGDYLGVPFVTLSSRVLAPGQSETIRVQFDGSLTRPLPAVRLRLVSGSL